MVMSSGENHMARRKARGADALYGGEQKTIYNEFVSHMKETDEEVPYPHGGYYYYTRTVKGLPYQIHCRKKDVGFP
eukprot:3585712-Rhodomonas_salina.1